MVANTCSVAPDEEAHEMAIAPLAVEVEEVGRHQVPLRLVPGGRTSDSPPRGAAIHAKRDVLHELGHSISSHPAGSRRETRTEGPRPLEPSRREERDGDLSARSEIQRQVRRQTLARRRRTVAIAGIVAAGILLALPIRALGAMTLSGQETPGAVTAGLADGSTYVVQVGDTLHSIALKINPAAASQLEREMAASIGGRIVVPGEHIIVP